MNLREWRLCMIDGQRNGIVHLPTWTIFLIENDSAAFVRTSKEGGASREEIEELKAIAAEAFRKVRPMWKSKVCRHPHL
jgi:hypothetical protein